MKCPNCGLELVSEIDRCLYKCPECLIYWTGQELLNMQHKEAQDD